MKHFIYKYAGLFLIAGLLAGCMKEPNYPDEPQLEYKNTEARYIVDEFSDNGAKVNEIKLTWTFKDGDGDLGLSQEDLAERRRNKEDSINVFFETYLEQNDKYVKVNNNIGNVVNSYVFRLSPVDEKLLLEGELSYSFRNIGIVPAQYKFKSGDHMKYTIQMKDRAGNLSNKIETDPIPIYFE